MSGSSNSSKIKKSIVQKIAVPQAEECFPRGRASSTISATIATPATSDESSSTAATAGSKRKVVPSSNDVLFGHKKSKEEASSAAPSKKAKKNRGAEKPAPKTTETQQPQSASVVSFKNLKKGTLLMGIVKQVNQKDVYVSLPNSLTGVVALKETSDALHKMTDSVEDVDLTQLFTIGQFVPCTILSASREESGKRISLSFRTSLFNAGMKVDTVVKGATLFGSVSSIEDHGILLHTGIRGITGFVPMAEAEKADAKPLVGQIYFCSVLAMNAHTGTATLTTLRDSTVKTVTRGDSFNAKSFTPGMLVNVKVEKVLDNGLCVNFLGYFKGSVEQNHLGIPCHSKWKSAYDHGKNSKGRARIIYVDSATNTVTLCMTPHIVHLQAPTFKHEIGDIIEGATIQRIDRSVGMLLSLSGDVATEDAYPTWSTFTPGFVHISRVADEHIDRLEKKFKIASAHKCRVIGSSMFEGILNVTMKQSALEQAVMRPKDLVPGQKVRGKILALEKFGLLLQLGEGIKGLVPTKHLPKTALKKTQKMFVVGKEISARVLQVDEASGKIELTALKGLVSSEVNALCAFEDAKPNALVCGYISKISEHGIFVQFFNGVHGIVPMSVLKSTGVEDVEGSYEEGQIVKACVLKCDPAKKRLSLTLDTSHATLQSCKKNLDGPTSHVGDVVSCRIISHEESFARVEIHEGVQGIIFFEHLSDYQIKTDDLKLLFPKDTVLDRALVINKRDDDSLLTLTAKSILLDVPKECTFPRDFSELSVGLNVVGYIKAVRTFGVFVQFMGSLQGLIPLGNISDKFLQDASSVLKMGQSVRCVVTHVDAVKEQFILSMKSDKCGTIGDQYLNGYLNELSKVTFAKGEESMKSFQHYVAGDVKEATVLAVRDYGLVLSLEDETSCLLRLNPVNSQVIKERHLCENDKLFVRILDYSSEHSIFYVEYEEKDEKKKTSSKAMIAPQTHCDVEIISVNLEYAVVKVAQPVDEKMKKKKKSSSSSSMYGLLQLNDFHRFLNRPPSQEEVGSLKRVVISQSFVSESVLNGFFKKMFLCTLVETVELLKQTKKRLSDLPEYNSSEDLKVGALVKGSILSIKEDVLTIKICLGRDQGKILAQVSVVDVDVELGRDHETLVHPFDAFAVGDVVVGRILSVTQKGSDQRKPVGAENPAKFNRIFLSLKKEMVEKVDAKEGDFLAPSWTGEGKELLTVGKQLCGVIVEEAESGVWIQFSHEVRGFCHALCLSTSLDILNDFKQHFPTGKPVECCITSVDFTKHHLNVSLMSVSSTLSSSSSSSSSTCTSTPLVSELKEGSVVCARISRNMKAINPPSLMVQVSPSMFARVCITELAEPSSWEDFPLNETKFPHNTYLHCYILKISPKGIDASLRPSRIQSASLCPSETLITQPTVPTLPDVGDLVQGYVISTSSSTGCFVRLSQDIVAKVLLRDLADKFIESPAETFLPGRLVAGRVTKVEQEPQRIFMSLKSSVVVDQGASVRFSDLKVGMFVKGSIAKIEKYGVFVKIEGTTLSGLCHISELVDERIQDINEYFKVDDYVKAKILKIDGRRLSLGLKASYFEGMETSEEESSSEDEDMENASEDEMADEKDEKDEEAKAKTKAQSAVVEKTKPVDKSSEENVSSDDDSDPENDDESEDDSKDEVDVKHKNQVVESVETMHESQASDSSSSDSTDGEEEEEDRNEMDVDQGHETSRSSAPSLSTGLSWTGFSLKDTNQSSDESSDDSDSDSEGEAAMEDEATCGVSASKKKKREKKMAKMKEEEEIRAREKALAEGEAAPQVAGDYERLVASSPNSSFIWIKYMAFQMSMTEVDLARDVAERALTTINFREEQERFNVWVAYLNLEHSYGTEESFAKLFSRAAQHNSAKKVYLKLLDMYLHAKKHEDVEATLKTIQKKFKTSKQVWMASMEYYLQEGNHEKARELLQRSLKSLSKHKHIVVISKFAQLEYIHGSSERGRTLFEGMLSTYPKRMDLWLVYLDKEVKFGSSDNVRQLFDRLIHMKFSTKKIKLLFKKYAAYETKHGNSDTVAHVRTMAREYIENTINN